MRIAYVCSDFGVPIHGTKGASIHVRELTRALVGEGHQVIVVTARRGGPAPNDYEVPVVEVAPDPIDVELRDLIADDVAGGATLAGEIRGLLYASSLRQRALVLLRDWRPDVIYERHALPALAGRAIADELGIPHLLEVNAPLVREQARHRAIHLEATLGSLERQALAAADVTFVVSGPLADWAAANGADERALQVLSNAVDPIRLAAAAASGPGMRRQLGLDGGMPVIGFVGTLKPWHDVAGLVHAVGLLHREGTRAKLLIVGDGPQRAELERLALSAGVASDTVFTGAVPHDEVGAHLGAMDIGVVPYAATVDEEYFSPLKLFEYGAAGLPVVAADRGEIGHCIRDGFTGLLYRPGAAEALRDGMARLLADAGGRTRMGGALRAHVSAEHTWAGNARTVVAAAERLLAPSPLAGAAR